MLKHLRLRLTALYVLVGVGLLALVGGGTYQQLGAYFESTTDLALQHKLAFEFQALGVPLPAELAAANALWYTGTGRPAPPTHESSDDGDDHSPPHGDNPYDSELAAIFVLPLDNHGQLVLIAGTPSTTQITPDTAAVTAALTNGHDWRTVRLSDGTRLRLLTYLVVSGETPLLLQAGRSLSDQDRLLTRLLTGLLALGTLSVLLLGVGSWWIAGRSLAPTQQAWERQQAFVANASHELRTPLTLIRASSEIAQRGFPAADSDNRALLDDVLHEVDHMTQLVNDLLLLSRLDAGRLALTREPIDLPDLLADVQRQVGRLASTRGITLQIEASPDTLHGDKIRLRQVLLILLDNALRYTPRDGLIRIHTALLGRTVQITVSDSGAGIAPEHLPHLFERFYRAESAHTPTPESNSSGLGLAIAKALVEAMHGQIRVESALGQGTRARLVFPAG